MYFHLFKTVNLSFLLKPNPFIMPQTNYALKMNDYISDVRHALSSVTGVD